MLVQVQKFETGTRYGPERLHQRGKNFKLKLKLESFKGLLLRF